MGPLSSTIRLYNCSRSGKVNANADGLSLDQRSLAKVGGVSEALTKGKQKLIINKSSCVQPNRSKATDNSKHVDNLEELNIKEHVKECAELT